MFELTLSTTIDKQNYLSKLFSKLSAEIKQDAGVLVKQNNSGRAYLAMAVDEKKKEYYKSKVLDHILFMVIDDYKYNFYKEALQEQSQSIIYEAFLKAIAIFDADNDKEIIQGQIQLADEFLVDSFFYFKLGLLRARWAKTAEIIRQNKIITSDKLMIDVLKYLLAISDGEQVTADIKLLKHKYVIKNYNQTKVFNNSFKGKSNFFVEIIKQNPGKINLWLNSNSKHVVEIKDKLELIFADRVYLLN